MASENGLFNKSPYLSYPLRALICPSIRPKPLGSSWFAFLFPHVPLVPSLPSDVSDAGRSPEIDSELFPSDEQLNQRALWIGTASLLHSTKT